jgi:hypothetical protein
MKCLTVVPFVATLLVGPSTLSPRTIDPPSSERGDPRQVMLILRGIANAENPRGQLDDEAALAYAGRLRFKGEVLDIAGDNYAGNPQAERPLSAFEPIARSLGSTAFPAAATTFVSFGNSLNRPTKGAFARSW